MICGNTYGNTLLAEALRACAITPTALTTGPTVGISRIATPWRQSMKSFNRFATGLLIAGLFSLSACVFAGPGYYNRDARQAEARDHDNGRHDSERRGCDSEHHDDGCQAEHH